MARVGRTTPTASGAWKLTSCEKAYFLDAKFAAAVAALIQGEQEFAAQSKGVTSASVLELGAGCGCYTHFWQQRGLSVMAFDGAENIEALTKQLVRYADLSKPLPPTAGLSDWVVMMEVAEHVPQQYEGQLLENVESRASKGIVLSWAAKGQGGVGHVNEQSNAAVISKMKLRGWVHDAEASQLLRKAASICTWFASTVMVFVNHTQTDILH